MQHVAHRDAHHSPVQRVATGRIEQQAVDAEDDRAAGERAQILLVVQSFEHGDAMEPGRQLHGIRERQACGGGQHPAVHREPGDLVEHGAAGDVHVDGEGLEDRVGSSRRAGMTTTDTTS